MNSQDKPSEANDNLHESLEATSEINKNNNELVEKENFADLWTEEEDFESVTEFVTADSQDMDDPLSFLGETPQMSAAQTPKRDFDLELDDLDFRNPPKLENQSDRELETKLTNNDRPNDLENLPEPALALALDNSEFKLDDFELGDDLAELNSSSIEEPSGDNSLEDINLDLDNISEPALALDNSEFKLDDFELGDDLAELNSSSIEEPSGDNSLEDINLDLDNISEPALALDNSEFKLDDFELGDDLAELNSSIEEPSGDNSLEDINLDLDNISEPALALDNSEFKLDDFELGDDLDSLIEEPLGEDSLDNLESILEPETESLDSLILESIIEVEESETVSVGAATKSSEPDLSSNKGNTFDQTMRVSVRQLDNLNNLIGELVVKRNRLEDDQERLRRFLDNLLGHVQSLGDAGARMHDLYERSLLEGALIASRQSRIASASQSRPSFMDAEDKPQEEGLDALEMDRFNGFHLLSQDIIELIVRVREAASDIQFVVDETDKVAQTFRQVTSQLQDGMNSSRMVAFGQTADRLPRAIRDISRKQKKQTELQVEGKNVLIDKMIVEHLYNPMTHLVNNAISHGIEKPEERLKKGKSATGNIKIHAFIQGNQTVITVSDDGAGINPEIVKTKAVEKKLITWATAQNLSEQQIYELLFHPGFSTKDEADDFAGRGVGMDVVNTDLKKIRGSISTESELGKGTTFTIRLPLVLSICKALTCVDNHTKVAFPIDGVEDTKEYLPSDIQTNANGVRCISWRNKLLPLRPLNSLLSYNRQIRRAGIYNSNQNNDDTVSVIILRSLDNLLAVEVDEVKAEQEIVIKQIDGPIPKPPGIAGATVLGDGTIMPIGDVLELIEIAQGKRTIEIGFNILGGNSASKQLESENLKQEPMVLVVDDSITVRELLSLSFTKLGYRVEQARDGQEAWDKLRGGLVCDMIFSDIEMPRMNGLELLANLQKHEELKLIPVAMLTSRGADKHRKIANDLGAKAYLTKPYTEKTLMDVAQHLIEVNRANKEAESKSFKQDQLINSRKSESEIKDAPLVLIIDDSVTVRELLSMTFKKAGYRVEQARDGQEAWNKLSGGLNCDIAFCDIEMPRMNGLELLSQLQKDEKLSSLPIAMLTSRGAQKMRNIAAKRGANGYFVKPYVEDDLLEAARRMMNGEMLIENADEDEPED